MRELVSAVGSKKPIVAVLEMDTNHGAMSREEILARLIQADTKYEEWDMLNLLAADGWELPCSQMLYDALFARPAIEWNRISGLFIAGSTCGLQPNVPA